MGCELTRKKIYTQTVNGTMDTILLTDKLIHAKAGEPKFTALSDIVIIYVDLMDFLYNVNTKI